MGGRHPKTEYGARFGRNCLWLWSAVDKSLSAIGSRVQKLTSPQYLPLSDGLIVDIWKDKYLVLYGFHVTIAFTKLIHHPSELNTRLYPPFTKPPSTTMNHPMFTKILSNISPAPRMKLTTTLILTITSLALAGPSAMKRTPTGLDYALLAARCVHQECHCTGFDPSSCSGEGCHAQCNTGGKRDAIPELMGLTGRDVAILETRCVHKECHCTGFDPKSCSGEGCGAQCNGGR